MDALLVVDMQTGMLEGEPKHDLDAVIGRINRIAARARAGGGSVFFVQHDGAPGDDFAPEAPGWPLLDALEREPNDRIVPKSLNSAFAGTSLRSDLEALRPDRVLVTGWATDFCVDATVRSAAELEFPMVVVSDAHTVCNRPHLPAEQIIEHHHSIWPNLFAAHPIHLLPESEV